MKRLAGIISMLALTGCAALEPATQQQTGWAGAWGASPTIPPAGGKAFESDGIIVGEENGHAVVRASKQGSIMLFEW